MKKIGLLLLTSLLFFGCQPHLDENRDLVRDETQSVEEISKTLGGTGQDREIFFTIEDLWERNGYENIDINQYLPNSNYSGEISGIYAKVAGGAHESDSFYAIDDENRLWSHGENQYGQLGNGQASYCAAPLFNEQWYHVADDVIHIVYSGEYFAAYLTADFKLYGMGANLKGLMGLETNIDDYAYPWLTVAATPRLLMEDVIYAACSYTSLLILKSDGTLWELGGTYARAGQPKQILEDVRYVCSGNRTCGAIKEDGSLWMWGENYFGSCGIDTAEGVIEAPALAAEDVAMCWIFSHPDQTIIRKQDGSYWICGYNIGDDSVSMDFYGEMGETLEIPCSFAFIPLVVN